MCHKVIFIGAHPDDIELGCAATIIKFIQNGFEVHCHFLTRGERCGHPEIREEESIRALNNYLSVPKSQIHFAPQKMFQDTRIPDGSKTINYLEAILNFHQSLKSDSEIYAVFTHSIHDSHQDHRAIANSSLVAFRGCKRLYCYESPSSTNNFNPSKHLGFDQEILDLKTAALECHISQINLNRRYLQSDSAKALALFRSRKTSHAFAEAFEIIWDELDVEQIRNNETTFFGERKTQPFLLSMD